MPEARRLSLHEFKEMEVPGGIGNLISQFNGGTFMDCHRQVFEATGIWVEELVPVFERLDAMVALRDLRPEAVR
jgi:hypothetical protein